MNESHLLSTQRCCSFLHTKNSALLIQTANVSIMLWIIIHDQWGGPVWLIFCDTESSVRRDIKQATCQTVFLQTHPCLYLISRMCWQWREIGWSTELWLFNSGLSECDVHSGIPFSNPLMCSYMYFLKPRFEVTGCKWIKLQRALWERCVGEG